MTKCFFNFLFLIANDAFQAGGADKLPFRIKKTLSDHRRSMSILVEPEISRSFYDPLSRGEVLTDDLLCLKPEKSKVRAPERGPLLDVIEVRGMWAVNDKVKTIIETLEPELHTFIPINLQLEDRNEIVSYYYIHSRQAIDSVSIEETKFAEGFGREGFEKSPAFALSDNTIVLRKDRIAGRHFWRGSIGKFGKAVPFSRNYFCSDELKQLLDSAGVTGWSYHPCRTSYILSVANMIDSKKTEL